MSKSLKIIFGISLFVLALLVLNLVVNRTFLADSLEYGYEAKGKKALFQKLFKPEVQKKLNLKGSFGNDNEQISINSFDNYDIFIWNITGFKEIEMDSLLIGYVDHFDDIIFNPKRYIDWGVPQVTLSSKMENLVAKQISVNISEQSKIEKHLRGDNFLSLNLKSDGFAVYNRSLDYLLKIEIDRFLEFEVCFLKDSESFKIILFKPNSQNELTVAISDLLKPELFNYR